MSDVSSILIWWATLGILGAIAYPLTARLFHRFADRGYIFSKIIGLLLSSYVMWLTASLHILSFDRLSISIILLGFLMLALWFKSSASPLATKDQRLTTKDYIPWRWIIFGELLFLVALSFWSYVRATEPSINGLEKFMDFGFMNSILRSQYFPPLDMWLAKSPDYPGGQFINYYYYGHYYAAFLTKLSGLEPAVTYNLMLATLFAFTFTLSFSLGMNAWHLFQVSGKNARRTTHDAQLSDSPPRPKDDRPLAETSNFQLLIVGLLSAFVVALAGNLHTIYMFTEMYPNHEEPIPFWKLKWGWHPDSYWYPDATRFIPNTIHEFPIYSFVVADLHGHVSDIPFVLLTVAVLLSLLHHRSPLGTLGGKTDRISGLPGFLSDFEKRASIPLPYVLFLGLLLAVMYMTNAWDGLIYMALAGLTILACIIRAQSHPRFWVIFTKTAGVFLVLLFTFILASLPFSRNFQPFVSGIGVLCPPNAIFRSPAPTSSTTDESVADPNVRTLGPLLFEKDHCQRSPLYMIATLWGFFYFNALGFLFLIVLPKVKAIYLSRRQIHESAQMETQMDTNGKKGEFVFIRGTIRVIRELSATDIFMLILIFISTLLIIFPEFFYVKDIYPTHYRANTMFKLGYQAFMLMGLVSIYTVFRIKHTSMTKKLLVGKRIYVLLFLFLFYIVASYPYFAIRSYYDSLRTYHGLYGLNWLEDRYPDDYQAILWLNKNVGCSIVSAGAECTNQPVIVEANGDSYTDYDRVSANTGLPTIIGWPVHEWLWRGSYDEAGRRIPEVETIYVSEDIENTKEILKKYTVEYIFLGQLEREKYKELDEAKLDQLGMVVFQSGDTKVYRVSNP